MDIQTGQNFRHFKGIEVRVIGIAKHSETLEEMVVYEHNGEMWTRPKNMWFDEVNKDGYKGPRFKLINGE